MLTVTKSVEVEAEVEIEIYTDDIVEAARDNGEELEIIGRLIDGLGKHDTFMVMHFCMQRLQNLI